MIVDKNNSLLGEYAGFFSRTVAYILDILIISLSVLAVNFITWLTLDTILGVSQTTCALGRLEPFRMIICDVTTWSLMVISLGFFPVYFIILWILGGQTIGNRLMGIRVVRLNGHRNTLFTALKRLIGYVLCFLTFGLGFLAILVNDRRQGWHDRIAGTVVIYAWTAHQDEAFLMRLKNRWQKKPREQVSQEES